MTQTIHNPPGYTAALEGLAWRAEHNAGRIWMLGRDRAALLQRLSTNDIERLRPGQGTRSVLTTPIGRIIDLLHVYALEDRLLLVTSPGQGPLVFGHLRKNIFFNDQVTLEPAGRSHGQFALYGPLAAQALTALAGVAAAELALHQSLPVTLAGVDILLARSAPLGGHGFMLYVPTAGLEAATAALVDAGAAELSDEAFAVLRVEHGYAAFGSELSQEYIPLETGLLDAVSFTKGCYVGQEIIARMESRGRLAKRLMGVRLDDERRTTNDERRTANDERRTANDGRRTMVVPAKLEVDGKEAGDLTSVVVSPRFGMIGLAYMRSAYASAGALVGVAGSNTQAELLELPF